MSKLICNKCENIFKGDMENKKLSCNRCKSNDFSNYNNIKRYFKCNSCKHIFKISEVTARYIYLHKEKPECTVCHSKQTERTTKSEYLKNSGQTKKIHNTKIMDLNMRVLE